MKEKLTRNPFILLLLITGAVYFFLRYLSPLLSPMLAAVLFVTIFGPLLKFLQEKCHIRRRIGAVILLVVAGVAFTLLLWILLSWIAGSLPQWLTGLGELESSIHGMIDTVSRTAGKLLDMDVENLKNTISGQISSGFEELRTGLIPGMLAQSVQYIRLLAKAGAFLITFLISVILLAKDYDMVMNKLLDREDCHVFLEVMCGVIRYIATYIKAQFVIMLVISLIAASTLGIAGIPYGILWGILAGLMDALPFIGTGIVLTPLAIGQILDGNAGRALVCGGLYLACAFMRELLEPKLIGKRIGVNPLFVLISLYAGIQLFGAWGIIKGPLGFIIIYQTFLSIKNPSTFKGIPHG